MEWYFTVKGVPKLLGALARLRETKSKAVEEVSAIAGALLNPSAVPALRAESLVGGLTLKHIAGAARKAPGITKLAPGGAKGRSEKPRMVVALLESLGHVYAARVGGKVAVFLTELGYRASEALEKVPSDSPKARLAFLIASGLIFKTKARLLVEAALMGARNGRELSRLITCSTAVRSQRAAFAACYEALMELRMSGASGAGGVMTSCNLALAAASGLGIVSLDPAALEGISPGENSVWLGILASRYGDPEGVLAKIEAGEGPVERPLGFRASKSVFRALEEVSKHAREISLGLERLYSPGLAL